MQPGDQFTLTFDLLDADNARVSGEAANLSLRAYQDGAAASVSETISEIGSTGSYKAAITLPNTTGMMSVIFAHSGGDIPSPAGYAFELESYDTSALAGLILTSAGVPATISQADTDLGQVVDGDAWGSGTITVALAKLTRVGLSDLSGGTLTAAFKSSASASPVTSGITATIVSAGDREVSVSWTTFPAGLALASGEESAVWYLDVQFKHTSSGKIVTVFRGQLTVVWERDETT